MAISEHIERDSLQNAVAVLQDLFDAIDSLDQLPYRHPIYRKARANKGPVHRMPVPPFLVYYRPDDDEHVVEIVCVRHGARRQPRSFN